MYFPFFRLGEKVSGRGVAPWEGEDELAGRMKWGRFVVGAAVVEWLDRVVAAFGAGSLKRWDAEVGVWTW